MSAPIFAAIAFLFASECFGAQGYLIATAAGNGLCCYNGDGGSATGASLNDPTSIAVDPAGNLYIADRAANVIRRVATNGTITTVAGNGSFGFFGDEGPATSAMFNSPWGVAVDTAGNIYIADTLNQRIRRVATSGTITTVAGNGSAGFSGDNGAATGAQLNWPEGVAVDTAGNLYIADSANLRIRKVSTAGTITTIANTSFVLSIAVDVVGNLYIADLQSNMVRKVGANGTITTIAGDGTQGYSGDGGPATSAELNLPRGVSVDAAGNVFIADTNNSRIRRISALNGIITTVAGTGSFGHSGDGGPANTAQIYLPNSVAADLRGNVYIAEEYVRYIRALSPPLSKLAAFNASQAAWLLDSNGNFVWDGTPIDFYKVWGSPSNIPVVGDWSGSGTKKIGVFKPSTGVWLLDMNGNGLWDGPDVDKQVSWGSPGDTPVVGNWNGSGAADKIGTFNPNQGTWLLDFNGNFTWDGAATDKLVAWGSPGDKPVVGDWNGSGTAKIGIFNPTQGWWLLDYNGNYVWEGAGTDRFLRWGSPGDTPVVGDWNASGATKIGVFNSAQSVWLLDYNGNYTWDGAGTDKFLAWGSPGDVPIVGDWNGTGTSKIAVFNPSQGWWVIDYNGNYTWEGAATDRFLRWGSPGDAPLVGKW